MSMLEERLSLVERQLDRLEQGMSEARFEVASIRAAQAEGRTPAPLVRQPEPAPAPAAPVVAPIPPPVTTEPILPPPREPVVARPTLGERVGELDLLGARTLAIVGGIVMLLGVAFLFALAVNRGWVGPSARVAIGAIVSTLAVVAGLVIRRRLGDVYAAQAAVGVGIAGGYLTLLAATALYGLVGDGAGLVGAAAIATIGTLIAWRWSSEILAGLGLIGALLVPLVPAYESRPTATGVTFAILMFAGAAAVAVARRWEILLGASAAVLAVQLLVLGADGVDTAAAVTAVLFGGVALLSAGVAWAARGPEAPRPLALSLAVASGGVVTTTLLALLDSHHERGVALLAFALVPAVAAAGSWRRSPDFALACAGSALIASSVGTADLLSGGSLTVAWAVQAAVLGWLGGRRADMRIQLVGLAYLGLALGNAIAFEEIASALFEGDEQLAHVPSAIALGVGGLAFVPGSLDRLAAFAGVSVRDLRHVFSGLAGVAGLYALGLVLVAGSEPVGQVATTLVWSIAGLAVVALGSRRDDPLLTGGGLAWLVVADGKALGYDLGELSHRLGSTSVAGAAVAVLLAGVAARLLTKSGAPLALIGGVASVLAGIGLAIAAIQASNPDGFFAEGSSSTDDVVLIAWLSAIVLLYGSLTAASLHWRHGRNVAPSLWLVGLLFLLWLEAEAIEGIGVFVAILASAGAIAAIGRRVGEPRLVWTGTGLLGVTTAYVIADLAPVSRFFEANAHPGAHAWAPLCAALAAGVCAWAWRARRRPLAAAACILGLYALSLTVLEVVESASTASIETDFQRGHMFVTAIWAVLGLALLSVGLTRTKPVFRYVGLGLFGVALTKLFVFDLSYLSSMTRSAAFLVVGALLLAGGALVQRLNDRSTEPTQTRRA